MTQKGAAFISRSYFHNEVLLIHEHNYIVLFAFCVAGREQRAELLLETPGITSLQAWYSRDCSEFLCLCPGDKVAPDRAQHLLADPISPPDKNFFSAAPGKKSQFSYSRGSRAWAGPCWEQAAARQGHSAPADSGANKCKSLICLNSAGLQITSSWIHILAVTESGGR